MKKPCFVRSIILSPILASVLAAAALGDGFVSTGSMAYNRYNHTATRLLDGRVLVVAGRDADSGPLASAELYNPATGTWTTTSSLLNLEDREFHTATLLPNGKVLVVGGLHQAAYTYLAVTSQLYDPANGTWSYGGPSGLYGHTATLLQNGKVLIVGGTGIQGAGPYRAARLYDPASNSSVFTGNMGTARAFHTATLLTSGKVLVQGGGTNTVELYNPTTGTWSTTGSLPNGQSYQTATLLPNGKVLVVGTSAEVYDPGTGTWSPAGSPAHAAVSATSLPNGKVLVVELTYDESWQVLQTAELYDPASGAWSAAPDPVLALGNPTATLLSNGLVLLAAGAAELFESSPGRITNPVRVRDGSFQFSFSNPSGSSYHILASPNLMAPLNTWSNLGTATETSPGSGQFLFTDHQATNYSQRFYRVSSP